MANTATKTPIIYYGGKTSILNHIMPLIPVHEVYTEVFLGGGTVFWSKAPARNETINDRLDIVINFYRCLQWHYVPLKEQIDATLIGRSIHNEALTVIRTHKKSKKAISDYNLAHRIRLAWAFWVCTNFAYRNKIGGGYKYSNDLSVCVPDTCTKRKMEFTELLVARIEHVYIENEDALHVLHSRNVKNAFHYIDPPYPNTDQGHYGGYGWDQYETLLDFLETTCKGKFLLSSYNSPMLQDYFQRNQWWVQEITHQIKSPRKTGTTKVEVLVRNYANTCQTLQLQFP